tara:strand:- start:657 stop:785 length:129 start_codon:yes stop_codon:yes gene_type:complete
MIYEAEIERRTLTVLSQENWDKMPSWRKEALLEDPYCEIEVV